MNIKLLAVLSLVTLSFGLNRSVALGYVAPASPVAAPQAPSAIAVSAAVEAPVANIELGLGPQELCNTCNDSYEGCIADCEDDSFCQCECRNAVCYCEMARCSTHCWAELCGDVG